MNLYFFLIASKQTNVAVVVIICVPDVAKNINIKGSNLMSRTNETKYIERNETCKCKIR